MKRIQVTLLSVLKSTTSSMTSAELSSKMGISVRYVKMHVKLLNQMYPNLITPSRKGYRLNASAYEGISRELRGEDVPYNSRERVEYMLKAILLSPSAVLLDANNFAEELGASSSTIQNDLRAIKSLLSEYGLCLAVQNQNLHIEGKEEDIRRLMNSVLLGEIQESFRDTETLKKVFPEYDLDRIHKEMEFLAQAHQVTFSASSLFSLTLHVLIVLNRLQSSCYTQTRKEVRIKDFTSVGALVQSLVKYLTLEYDVKFPSSEINELITLFASYQSGSGPYQLLSNQYAGDSAPTLTQILDQASAIFLVDLQDSEYVKALSIYIRSFYSRAGQAPGTKNPLTDMIKKKCPFIYDIAAYIFIQLQQQMNIMGGDDEIALLAVHIGSILERKKEEKDKLLCYFVCQEYTQFGEEFCQKVDMLYGNTICLELYPSFGKLPQKRAALLISPVIDREHFPADYFLQVLPFFNEKDLLSLGNKINEIQTLYKRQTLKKQLDLLFLESMFSTTTSFETYTEAISHIVSIMDQKGYVHPGYLKEVMDRERLSSTAFGKVAIPHSLKMDAIKTGVYVLIQKSGIKWGENLVHIVLLLTVNKSQRRNIQDILECIADIMTDERMVQRILSARNFPEFMHIMKSGIS